MALQGGLFLYVSTVTAPERIWLVYARQLQGYTSLNRIQSIVYPTAYGTNENLLICGTYL